MPNFIFHVHGETDTAVELADLATAKCEAVRYAGKVICDSANTFWRDRDFRMTVTDERGLALFSLHLIGTEAPAIRNLSESLEPSVEAKIPPPAQLR